MKRVFKKILVNFLVLMVMTLPLRVISMPIDMSADHCMSGDISSDMSTMQHEGHHMPAVNGGEQTSNRNCCDQCVGDCTDCASLSVVTFDQAPSSETRHHEIFTIAAELLFTHITSPPSRPPLSFHI